MDAGDKLLILLKAPLPGLVKTRIAAQVGSEMALTIYQQLLNHVLREMADLVQVELNFTPASGHALVEQYLRPTWTAQPQGEGDLGERMQAAFAHAFNSGARRVVMIGTDCPDATCADIESAFKALHRYELVLGPAADGGYWLIGLDAPRPELFRSISWSTSGVLVETLERAKQIGCQPYLLRTLADMDTIEDWLAYQARHPAQTLE